MQTVVDYLAKVNAMDLDALLLESAAVGKQAGELEVQKKAVNGRILSLMQEAGMLVGQSYFRDDGINARIGTRVTKTINRAKLIQKDIPAEVIDACTDETTSAPFITVTVPKPKS